MFFFHQFPHTAAKARASRLERERLVLSNVSLESLNILFYLACVSKIALYCTLQLRIERQSIFWGGICSFFTVSRTRLLRLERQGLREERLALSNVSLVSLSVLFHPACVSKRAVCRTRQLRIERQLIFW